MFIINYYIDINRIYYMSKLLMISYLSKWIHFSSLFQALHDDKELLITNKKKNKKNKEKDDINSDSGVKKGPILKIVLFFLLFIHIASSCWISLGSDIYERKTWIDSAKDLNKDIFF